MQDWHGMGEALDRALLVEGFGVAGQCKGLFLVNKHWLRMITSILRTEHVAI